MAILTFMEFFDLIIITLATGFIFKDTFRIEVSHKNYDPLAEYHKPKLHWSGFWIAVLGAAPAIILHEFGHKFVAMFFGLTATLHAAYMWLGLGVVLKLISSPIIFIVPAFVSFQATSPINSMLIGFAGPFINLLLYLIARLWMDYGKVPRKYLPVIVLTRKLNGFLFIFNLIPLPGFDGFHVLMGLIGMFSA